jgi:hypothetical protein
MYHFAILAIALVEKTHCCEMKEISGIKSVTPFSVVPISSV